MFLILCELAVLVCVALCSQKSDNTIFTHQFGFQICVKLCSTYGGCRSHAFDPVQLRCTFEIMTVESRKVHDVNLTTEACAPSTSYSRAIQARKKGTRNATQTLKVSRYKNANKKGATRNKKADKKGVTRNKEGHQNGATKSKEADKKGLKRKQKDNKNGAARTKKADKTGKDVTQKRRRENKLGLVQFPKTWYKARNLCKGLRLTLVMPKTKEQVDDLSNLIHDICTKSRLCRTWHRQPCFWFGLSDIYRNNTFFWIDGKRPVNSSVMFRRQILFVGRQAECGAFHLDSKMRLKDWRSAPCGKKCKFFCQK